MSASNTDKIRKASSSGRAIATSLSSPKVAGSDTAELSAATGWNTETGVDVVIYRKDNDGKKDPATQTDWVGVLSGTTVDDMVLKAGTEPTGGYPADSLTVVICSPTAAWANDLADALLNEHKQTGAHENITTDSITNNGDYIQSAGEFSVPANVILKAALEKPHHHALIFSTDGASSGQVVTETQAHVNFDASETDGYGIEATTGAGAYLKIMRDGTYILTIQTRLIDATGVFPKNGIVWFKISYDNGATWFYMRQEGRSWLDSSGQAQLYSMQTFLPANTRVAMEAYCYPGNIRIGNPAASGTLTSYQARRTHGSYLSIVEIR